MGAGTPKRYELYAELEEQVKDAILLETDDIVLAQLIELTAASITDGRPLFPTLLDEPQFYRVFFRRWVEEGLKEAAMLQQIEDNLVEKTLGGEAPPPASLPNL